MELRQLQYFREVCYTRNFTKAAKNLFVSQPVITNSIQKLEDELEVRLLNRDTKKVTLTSEGDKLLKKAEQILNVVDEAYREMADANQYLSGLVKLGMPVQIGNYLFPRILSEFRINNPEISLSAVETVSGKVINMIDKEELDVGIIVLPNMTLPNMQTQILFKEEVLLCVSEKNPLAQQKLVSFNDLKDEFFIMRMPGSIQRTIILNECKKHDFLPKIVFSSSQVQTIKSLVASNIGVSFLMKLSLLDHYSGLVTATLTNPLHLSIGMIWKNGRYLSKSTQEFIDYMLLVFKK